MIPDIIFLIVGLALILAGANMLTDGASAVARRWGVSDMVVGLTVVAFGTSAPELVISVVSSVKGQGELAIGNAVGSNIFNILGIIGITALVRPIKVERGTLTSDIPLVLVSSLTILIFGSAWMIGDGVGRTLWRSDGLVLLLFFAIFMRYTFSRARDANPDELSASSATEPMPAWKAWLWVALGLGGLVYGGDRFVDGASGIARVMGVSDAVIGLTIVSVGTSLPELATSITAALKGKQDLAVGNVIGSNIFNIFFVLGTSAAIRPLAFGSIGIVDLGVLTLASVLFWVFGWFFRDRIFTRAEGAVLTAVYIGYVAWLVVQA